MKVLVTGVKGQLGYDVVKELEKRGMDAVGVDIEEMDITDAASVEKVLGEAAPDAVIHCAAYTAVDAAEEQEELCRRVNADGTRNIARMCKKLDIKMIYISTDYVFNGQGTRPWEPEDERQPLNVYGQTKCEGEEAVQELLEKYFIVRIAWVFGVKGKNFVKTMLRLAETGKRVTVVNDQYGSPTSAVELAKMIHFLEPTENYGTYHATCEGQCSWADFAVEIFKMAGKNTKVKYVTSEEYNSPTKRPEYSVLDNYMLRLVAGDKFVMADWHDALKYYFDSGVLQEK